MYRKTNLNLCINEKVYVCFIQEELQLLIFHKVDHPQPKSRGKKGSRIEIELQNKRLQRILEKNNF